jgi:hypothetical protein
MSMCFVFIQCLSPTDPVKYSSNTTVRQLRIAKFVIEILTWIVQASALTLRVLALTSKVVASALRVLVLKFCP